MQWSAAYKQRKMTVDAWKARLIQHLHIFKANTHRTIFWNGPLRTDYGLKLQLRVGSSWKLSFPCPGIPQEGRMPSSGCMEHPDLGKTQMLWLRYDSDGQPHHWHFLPYLEHVFMWITSRGEICIYRTSNEDGLSVPVDMPPIFISHPYNSNV